MTDEEFFRKYEAHEKEAARGIVKTPSSLTELTETVRFLIRRRETLRDNELHRLAAETEQLLQRLKLNVQRAVVEIKCLKNVLALHKRTLQRDSEEHGNNRTPPGPGDG